MHRGSITIANALIFSCVLLLMHAYIHIHTWYAGPITIFCALIYDSFVWWASSLTCKSMRAYVYTNLFCMCACVFLVCVSSRNVYIQVYECMCIRTFLRWLICLQAWMHAYDKITLKIPPSRNLPNRGNRIRRYNFELNQHFTLNLQLQDT